MHRFGTIIESLYATSLGLDSWDSFVKTLHDSFPGTKTALISDQLERPGGCRVIQHGYDDRDADSYVNYYSKINPWTPHVAKSNVLLPILSDDILPSSTFRDTEFYYDFIDKVGDIESAAGIKLFDDRITFSFLNLHYSTSMSGAYNRILPNMLSALSPHLQNAVELSRRLNLSSYPRHSVSGIVNQFEEAAFLIDPRGSVIEMNDHGCALLDQTLFASLVEGERLHIFNPTARAILKRRLATPLITPVSTSRAGRRSAAWRFLEFLYSPLDARIGWLPPGGKWMIALFDVTHFNESVRPAENKIGLTHQEANVARALMTGLTAKEAATALGISYHTVRQHLKAIFAKTKTNRQAQLVAALAGVFEPIENSQDRR